MIKKWMSYSNKSKEKTDKNKKLISKLKKAPN